MSPWPKPEGVAHGSGGKRGWGGGGAPVGRGWWGGTEREPGRDAGSSGTGNGGWPSSAVGLGSEGGGGRPPRAQLPGGRGALCPTGGGRGRRSGLGAAVGRRLVVAGGAVRGALEPQHLPLHQPGVEAALGQQLLVRALLHHAAAVQHHDEVRPLHRAQPVRDDEHRVLLQVAVDGLLDLGRQEGPAHSGAAGAAAAPPRPGWDPSAATASPRERLGPSSVKPALAHDLLPGFLFTGDRARCPGHRGRAKQMTDGP